VLIPPTLYLFSMSASFNILHLFKSGGPIWDGFLIRARRILEPLFLSQSVDFFSILAGFHSEGLAGSVCINRALFSANPAWTPEPAIVPVLL
jgi:hypothetical protein